jgi:hypothetical protein
MTCRASRVLKRDLGAALPGVAGDDLTTRGSRDRLSLVEPLDDHLVSAQGSDSLDRVVGAEVRATGWEYRWRFSGRDSRAE